MAKPRVALQPPPESPPKARRVTPMQVMLDDDDVLLLDESARAERLTKSDVMRRALRAYHRELLNKKPLSLTG